MIILCLKVFLARIVDVSLGTTRVILTVKDKKFYAALCGFFEALVWLTIVKEVLTSELTSIWVIMFYAGGFATGTYIGTFLSNKFIKGTLGLQIVLSNESEEIIDKIRKNGFAVSAIKIKGMEHDKHMLFIEVNKRSLNTLKKLIQELDPKAFIVVNETKAVTNGFIK